MMINNNQEHRSDLVMKVNGVLEIQPRAARSYCVVLRYWVTRRITVWSSVGSTTVLSLCCLSLAWRKKNEKSY